MNKTELNKCMEICLELERSLENDSQVPHGCLGGTMLLAYEEARRSQVEVIKMIYKRLCILERRSEVLGA